MSDDSGDTGAVLASLCTRMDELTEAVVGLQGEVRFVRAAVDEVIGRLDDGLVLADEIVTAPQSVPAELRDLLATLRSDLVALRRRVELRAEGRVLSLEQLEQIAQAVAQRLAPAAGRPTKTL
jgi:hypothetical protein